MLNRLWYISRCSLFERLATGELAVLENHAILKRFQKGETVFAPPDCDDHVFLVAEGRVRLSNLTPDGKRIILAYVEPGEVFGEVSLIDIAPREERAEAETNCTVVRINGAVVRDLMERSPLLALGVTKLVSFRRVRIERRLKSLLFRSTRDRLIHLLLELAETYGKRQETRVLLEIRLSHQDMASIIGATRESVTHTLGELQLAGYLKVSRQRLTITNLHGLAKLADIPAPKLVERSHAEVLQDRILSPSTNKFHA